MNLDRIFSSQIPGGDLFLLEVKDFRESFGDAELINLMSKALADGIPSGRARDWPRPDVASLRHAMAKYTRKAMLDLVKKIADADDSDEAVAARSGKTKTAGGPLNALTKKHRMSLIADVACKTVAFLKRHDPLELNEILTDTIYAPQELADWTQLSNRDLKTIGEALGRALNRPAKTTIAGELLIRVEGAPGAGKTRLIEGTIIPALKLHGYLPAPTSGIVGADAEEHVVGVLPPPGLPENSILTMLPKDELVWLASTAGKAYLDAVAGTAERGPAPGTMLKNRIRFLGRVYSRLKELAGHTDGPGRLI